MEQLRSTQARDWREGRRLRTWELHQQGWKQHEIATALGVTQGAAASGCAGLERAVALKHSVAAEHRARLRELLAGGAKAYGFRGEVWTCARVAEVIRKEFDVSYHPAHVSRL